MKFSASRRRSKLFALHSAKREPSLSERVENHGNSWLTCTKTRFKQTEKNPSKARVSGIRCNNKRKIFSFLTRPSWRRRSSAPTNTLVPANASIACCPLRQFRVCVVRLVLACTVHRGTTTSSKSQKTETSSVHTFTGFLYQSHILFNIILYEIFCTVWNRFLCLHSPDYVAFIQNNCWTSTLAGGFVFVMKDIHFVKNLKKEWWSEIPPDIKSIRSKKAVALIPLTPNAGKGQTEKTLQ